jgi:hypothetical protein
MLCRWKASSTKGHTVAKAKQPKASFYAFSSPNPSEDAVANHWRFAVIQKATCHYSASLPAELLTCLPLLRVARFVWRKYTGAYDLIAIINTA